MGIFLVVDNAVTLLLKAFPEQHNVGVILLTRKSRANNETRTKCYSRHYYAG